MAIQRLTITRLDGTETTVTPCLADTLNFEATLKKNPRWGDLKENALKMQPFRAWSAGRREGTVTETWEEFTTSVAEVSFAVEEGTEDDDAEGSALGLDGSPTGQPTT